MRTLSLLHVTKCYGDLTALSDFTMRFEPGIYGILGANGAGKSTMMNLITDNIQRDEGQILYGKRDILELADKFRGVLGYMPQQQGIYEHMTAESFVSYIGRLKGLKGAELREECERVLELTNLSDVKHKTAISFSGGMKQRLLLAQALLGEPQVLLLDEPTAGLDPRERIRIRNFIKELSKDRIVLLATHIVSDIESIADQVLLMKKGKLIKTDTPQQLIDSIPDSWTPVAHYVSLEDVYLYYLDADSEETGR
ncbi:MAG: ATP-binding cassette domain-containing protein [Lachnospiraceae bacterium]|nr:ATP-binding cassette domain-containing protein [Lachnospiraceae bacterium]